MSEQARQAPAHAPRKLESYARTMSLSFFPDGERAVQVSDLELATLLHVQNGYAMDSWKTAASVATVSKDGKLVICGCCDGKLRILDAESQILTVETDGQHPHKVTALDVSTDSLTVASGSSDGSVSVWSITTGQRLAGPLRLDTSSNFFKVSSVQFSRCGSHLAASCASVSAVYILDVRDNYQLAPRFVVPCKSRVTTLSWSGDVNGQQRIFTGLKESLAVINPSCGSISYKPIANFRILSRNGKFIVSGTREDGVRFWDAATFVEIGPSLKPSCLPLAISPDNSLVTISVSTNHNGLSVWNLSDILPDSYINSDDGGSLSPSPTHLDSQALAIGGDEAIEVFNDMLSKIQLSPNPEVHRKHNLYTSPLQKRLAESIIFDVLGQRPPVLIDTRTGHLCHGPLRILALEVDPAYRNLLPLIEERGQERFRRGIETFFEYVMFSHKWDETICKEPLFHDVLGKHIYNGLSPSPTNDKLRRFCELVRESGYRWAWSDTCCIDRTDPAVLSRAVVSMYGWYAGSVLTLALLASVASPSKPGDLRHSMWMTRAWTLQELLAPRTIRFYDSAWKPYLNDPHRNHKDSPIINAELASAVSVASNTISTFRPSDLGVREKLRLASTRAATVEEDVAYSLFGIFASDLQPKYGEREDALGRLLEEIVHRSGDTTVLAWTGKPSRFNSCLPAEVSVYREPPSTISSSDTNKLKTRVVELQSLWPRETALTIYKAITDLRKKASFATRCLRLPCIAFSVDRISVVDDNPPARIYRASVSVLGDVHIRTVDVLPLREPHKLLVVHPWIHDLLEPPASLPSDDYTRALWLIARLRQKFSALLLQRQTYPGYKRVAADYEITAKLLRITSPQDICTKVLPVWNAHPSLPH